MQTYNADQEAFFLGDIKAQKESARKRFGLVGFLCLGVVGATVALTGGQTTETAVNLA
jgi:hypothetical protein